MTRLSLLLFSLHIFVGTVTAQSSGHPDLDQLLSQTLDSQRLVLGPTSLSAAIQFADSAVWADATGLSSQTDSVDIQDAYLIGSVTKTITSACILQLVDEGVLHLDDSLYQWLDTIQYIDPAITLRQLLRHQSGLNDVLNNPACNAALQNNPAQVWDAVDLVNAFILPPLATPGGNWSYCNTNYFLLGMVIESATGRPFHVELRDRFFDRLGLSCFGIPAFEVYNQPVAHAWMDLNGDGTLEDAHNVYYPWLALNSAAGAAGGYYATASDLTRWTRTYLRGDLTSPASMAEAKTLVTASGSQGGRYGLGLMRNSFQGIEAFGHGGDLVYSASSWYFPTLDMSISVLANQNGFTSWSLLPVVNALLRTYRNWNTATNIQAIAPIMLTVYPNPFEETLEVIVDTEDPLVWPVLRDLTGRMIPICIDELSEPQGRHLRIRLDASVPHGVYVLSLESAGRSLKTVRVLH